MNESSSLNKTRQRILEAGLKSFQSLGYERTTTQKIAEQAEVAEVTLFRHFGSKEKLFYAVVQQIGEGANLHKVEAQLMYILEEDLLLIGQHILHFFSSQKDAIRMLMFESIHFPEMREALAQNPRGMIELLSKYFEKQMNDGQIRRDNPQIMAQTFMSMIFGYTIGLEPIKELLPGEILNEKIIGQFVNIFLMGTKTSEY